MAQGSQGCARMAQKDLTIAGNANAAPLALKQADTQYFFQLTNRFGHRGLADMQQIGGFHHAFLPGNLDKGLKMTKLDALIDHISHNPQVIIGGDNVILLNRLAAARSFSED
ncbi:hypothetical protein RvVAR031_35600 [Agrobacterium vitis]|nr:hypothetical protein RvVAR031_35600 [Agrobacterium vitis]